MVTSKKVHRNSKLSGTQRLGDFTTDRRVLPLSFFALVIGTVCAFVAAGFLRLIYFFTNLFFYGNASFAEVSPAHNNLGWWVVIIPVIGGFIIGLMARYGSEQIRGHGIPEAMEAILTEQSMVKPRVAILKPLSAALSIGTGGPFGAEGPIIVTGGAFGSLFGQLLRLTASERKILLVAGAAGGMAATFNAPVASVLFAVEMLLFEWKPRSVIPVAVSAAIATLWRPLIIGSGPMFAIAAHPDLNAVALAGTVIIGIAAGVGALLLTMGVYGVEDLFPRSRIHWMWWPAIGGLVVGIGGYFFPRILGVGFDNIQQLLLGELGGTVLLTLLIAKAVVWIIALGSGTSGGVLAPLLLIGGSLGALVAPILPGNGSPAVWSLIGMAAIFAGTTRSPFTAIAFALELTRDASLIFPLMTACIMATAFTVLVLKRSILTEKLARRGVHVSREYEADPLELINVGTIMSRQVTFASGSTPVTEVAALMREQAAGWSHQGYPVLDGEGCPIGIITRSDIMKIELQGLGGQTTVANCLGERQLMATYPEEPLRRALDRMAHASIGRLPVVDRADGRLVGIISRSDIFGAIRQVIEQNGVAV